MLLGTYQPLFRAGCDSVLCSTVYDTYKEIAAIPVPRNEFGTDWNVPDHSKTRMADIAAIGFDPLWCFPCRDPAEAYVQSCVCSPNAPDLFFLIDSDDYIRIDRIKWEEAVRTGNSLSERLPEYIAGPDVDDACCDFLVPMEALSKFRCACMCLPAYTLMVEEGVGFRFFTPGKAWPVLADQFIEPMTDFDEAMEKTSAAFGVLNRGRLSLPAGAELSEQEIEQLLSARNYKLKFENTLLPALVSLNENDFDGLELTEFFRTTPAVGFIGAAFRALAAWSESDRSAEGYMLVLDAFRRLRCESDNVIQAWAAGNLPGRNDKCPCGSGRKFKKCCGGKYGLC